MSHSNLTTFIAVQHSGCAPAGALLSLPGQAKRFPGHISLPLPDNYPAPGQVSSPGQPLPRPPAVRLVQPLHLSLLRQPSHASHPFLGLWVCVWAPSPIRCCPAHPLLPMPLLLRCACQGASTPSGLSAPPLAWPPAGRQHRLQQPLVPRRLLPGAAAPGPAGGWAIQQRQHSCQAVWRVASPGQN